uniref:Immunoglobulin V-set domain-containing protein n=1 Tax=Callorhinchus milii TaxID=7868 RepID=A0A4W3GK37_CALMI
VCVFISNTRRIIIKICLSLPCGLQFALYRRKIIILKTEQFWDRVEWSGNPNKNDASVTIHELQLSDEGYYNCHVLNPPDRHKGLGTIYLSSDHFPWVTISPKHSVTPPTTVCGTLTAVRN